MLKFASKGTVAVRSLQPELTDREISKCVIWIPGLNSKFKIAEGMSPMSKSEAGLAMTTACHWKIVESKYKKRVRAFMIYPRVKSAPLCPTQADVYLFAVEPDSAQRFTAANGSPERRNQNSIVRRLNFEITPEDTRNGG